MAARGRHPRRLQPRRSTADDRDVAWRARRGVPVGILRLPPRRRFADARDERVAGVAHLARLVAPRARADARDLVGAHLGDEVRIGDLGAGHLDGIAARRVVVSAERPLGLADVDDGSLQHDRHVDGLRHRSGEVGVEAGRLVEVGPGLLDREDRATHDDEVVDTDVDELGGERWRHLRGDAGPRGELVARQPEADDDVGSDRSPHGADHRSGEQRAVGAPLVAAVVGQAGQELADDAVLAGVDLHAVAAGGDGELGGRGEGVDDRGDVLGLHPLRHLTGGDLGDARRCPQRRLVVGGGALAAGVVERGEDEAAVRPAGADDGSPAGLGARRQWGALVRPVGVVDAGPLDDDRPATAPRPPLVVGDVAGGEAAVVVAEVGHVRPEHHPVRRHPRPERERFQQLHPSVASPSECQRTGVRTLSTRTASKHSDGISGGGSGRGGCGPWRGGGRRRRLPATLRRGRGRTRGRGRRAAGR